MVFGWLVCVGWCPPGRRYLGFPAEPCTVAGWSVVYTLSVVLMLCLIGVYMHVYMYAYMYVCIGMYLCFSFFFFSFSCLDFSSLASLLCIVLYYVPGGKIAEVV